MFQLLGFCVASYVIYVFTEEDDSCEYQPIVILNFNTIINSNDNLL